MVVFDTTTLLVVLAPPKQVPVVVDGKLIADARERVDEDVTAALEFAAQVTDHPP